MIPLVFAIACQGAPAVQPTAPVSAPSPRTEVHRVVLARGEDPYEALLSIEELGAARVELTLPEGALTYPLRLEGDAGLDLTIRGAGAATVLTAPVDISGASSVRLADLRVVGGTRPLTLAATQSITLQNLSFLDQTGARTIPTRGALSMDHVIALNVDNDGAIALSDVSVLGARGVWPAVRMVAPGGTVTLARTLVAGGDRPPLFVGAAGALTIEDSVLVAPPGEELVQTVWPPGTVTVRRSTLVADTPEVVHPGNNPQAPASRYLPPRATDTTLYVRTRATGDVPAPDGAAIRPAPADAADLALLRARAEVLAPVDRAAIVTLLGLPEP